MSGLFRIEKDGSYALDAQEGYGDPFYVEAVGRETDVPYQHSLAVFWNRRGQLMIGVYNSVAAVQAAGNKALTLQEAKQLLAYLKRTIPEVEGHR